MTEQDKYIGHLAMWAQALLVHGAAKGARELGDRKSYLGMSDIGAGIECIRAAVAKKVQHTFALSQDDLVQFRAHGDIGEIFKVVRREITLQRGHWVEFGMVQALASLGKKYFTQLEIRAFHKGIPIQAHLDITLINSKQPAVRVLEMKSTKRLRRELFASHETQLYAQLGLIKTLWNKPAFNLRNNDGVIIYHDLSFPDLVNRAFGCKMPTDPSQVDIEGWVVSVAPDNMTLYGPYGPHEDTLKTCLAVAEEIWTYVTKVRAGEITLSEVPHNKGFHPLCDWCDHNASCSKFQGAEFPEYAEALEYRASIKEQIRKLEEDIRELDDGLKAAYRRHIGGERSEIRPGDWVFSGGWRYRVVFAADGTERLYVGTVNAEPETKILNTFEAAQQQQGLAA